MLQLQDTVLLLMARLALTHTAHAAEAELSAHTRIVRGTAQEVQEEEQQAGLPLSQEGLCCKRMPRQ